MTDTPHPTVAAILADDEARDVLEDVSLRVLNGDLTDPSEAGELLYEGLDDVDLLPEDEREAMSALVVLTAQLWIEAHATAEAWADEHTDVDRVVEAFTALDNQGIETGWFTDWPSLELAEDARGGVLIWVNAWEDLSHAETRDLTITFVGQQASDEEVGADLVAALRAAGLQPGEPDNGQVVVPVLWRHHVINLPDTLED